MTDEIQLISDGDGVAVIGDPAAVERFLTSASLPSRDLGLQRIDSLFSAASIGFEAASAFAQHSGRWFQVTEDSAAMIEKFGLMTSATNGLQYGVIQAANGPIKDLVQFVGGAESLLSPAVLAGAGGIMQQMALQKSMDEIAEYLATIDEKVDDILRAQKDAVVADMIGIDFVIEEAMTLREKTGRVSETTWSKVQGTSLTIARTQAYAIRQLDALADKLDRETDIGDLGKLARESEPKVQEWLSILARCVQLQDGIAILEIDRVLDSGTDELDQHRLALQAARQNRLDLIVRTTTALMKRMDAAAERANKKVLFNPLESPAVVRATNHVLVAVGDFHNGLGIERGDDESRTRRWRDAAADLRDKVLETGGEGIEVARRVGGEGIDRARTATNRVAEGIAERTRDRDEK